MAMNTTFFHRPEVRNAMLATVLFGLAVAGRLYQVNATRQRPDQPSTVFVTSLVTGKTIQDGQFGLQVLGRESLEPLPVPPSVYAQVALGLAFAQIADRRAPGSFEPVKFGLLVYLPVGLFALALLLGRSL